MVPNPPQAYPMPPRPLPRRASPWWVVAGSLAGGAVLFGGLVAYSSRARAAGVPPGTPPPTRDPKPKTRQPPSKGPPVPGRRVSPGTPGTWGTGTFPPEWDAKGNQLYVSPNCDLVLEGERFETDSKGDVMVNAEEAPTLMGTLAIPDNSVYGYIDYLINYEGYDSPETIALQVLVEANALCADLPPEQWPPALSGWFDDFIERIRPWIDESFGFEFELDS